MRCPSCGAAHSHTNLWRSGYSATYYECGSVFDTADGWFPSKGCGIRVELRIGSELGKPTTTEPVRVGLPKGRGRGRPTTQSREKS
jgi:hypothetical protein